jgi:hypothetical protein
MVVAVPIGAAKAVHQAFSVFGLRQTDLDWGVGGADGMAHIPVSHCHLLEATMNRKFLSCNQLNLFLEC